jgi:NAD(P)-dependent dehydrogenase (short-subunit alcohol dehydrogenase family)
MRTIFLTGASSGIGRQLALTLAAEGHTLALLARREALLVDLARALPGGTEKHLVLPADVGRAQAVEAAVERAEARLGPLDTVIYCAGSARIAPVEETGDDLWNETLAANLSGLFYTARAVVPRLKERGKGHFVAILSISSKQAFPGWSAYTAAKFGALGFIECLRAEVRKAGIHVTAVFPGATDTPIWDGLGSGWDRSRMMQPEQVARLVSAALRETSSGMCEEIRVAPVRGNI